MRLFKRGEKALTGTPQVVNALRDGWSPFPLLGGGARDRIVDAYNTAQTANLSWVYSRSPAVRAVIDTIVRNVGQLDLRLYEEVSEAERQPKPDHPAALSLRYPNETTTSDGFIRQLFKDFLIFDNAYALMNPAAGAQISFQWIPAHMVEVKGTNLFRAEIYRVWATSGQYFDYSPDNIVHWHGENPLDPRIGVSRLDTLRSVIAEDVALQQAIIELAQAGLQEPAWVYRPLEAPEWSNPARKGFEEDLANRLHRRNSKPVVLEEGMEMRSFGVSPQDAQMMEVRRWALAQTATQYGLPLGMIGLNENNSKEDQSQFYADTLPPYCEQFTKMLNQRLLVRVYDWTDGCFEFNLDEKLMGDDRLRALVSATGRAVMLTNEARAKVNLPPVAGGDELVTPLNVLVGDKPSPQVMPPQNPNGAPQDGSYRLDQPPPPEAPKALTVYAPGTEPAVTPGERLPRFHPRKAAEMERQHHNIDRMQAIVQEHFNRVQRAVNAKAQPDWPQLEQQFAGAIRSGLSRIVEVEGGIYAMKLGGGNFDMNRVRNYLKAMAQGAAGAINDTIRQEIDELGADEALARTPQHVQSAGASLGARSTIWAREEAAKQSPDYERRVKTWIADTDRHAEYDGDTVAVGDEWPAGFAPGGAPNCACSAEIS